MRHEHPIESSIIRDYWIDKMMGTVPSFTFTGPGSGNSYHSLVFDIDAPIAEGIAAMARNNKRTAFIIYLSFFGILLYKYYNHTELSVTSPGLQRDGMSGESENNLLFYKLEVTADTLLKNLLQNTRNEVRESFNHAHYNYGSFMEALKRKGIDMQPLYCFGFSHQGVHGTAKEFEAVNLQFRLEEKEDEPPGLRITFNRSRFDEHFIRQLATHYLHLLRDSLKNLDNKVKTMEILSPWEKKKILEDFNDTAAGFPSRKNLVDLFREQAGRFPRDIALHHEDRQLTYGELDKMSDELADELRAKGVKTGDIVGIKVERSMETVSGIMGILKSGGAYLPMDPDYPAERIDFMLKDSNAGILLKGDSLGQKKSAIRISKFITSSSEQIANDRNRIPLPAAHSPQLAYIIYTSGSTGKPKGVMVEHRNVVRLLFNERFQFTFNRQDTWTLFHSVCFDFSVWEIFGALLYGGRLVVVPVSTARTPRAFLNLLEKRQVTVLNQVPTMFYHLAAEILESKTRRALNLKYVIFGGEALSPILLKKWQEKYPEVKLVNMYGITETTVHVTYKEIGKREIEAGIGNIGKPIPTLTCYIVDENLVPVPLEVPGEIVVGGEGVSRGYLNRVELTREKFNVVAFSPGSPSYRSGDRGRRLRDGDIEYLGRIDRQVKIRGFRIECGEIEKRLLEIETVKDVKVAVREDKKKNKYLAAYLLADRSVTAGRCREYLEKLVPGYMVPSYFIQLEKFPLTPSGKVDKKALPDPADRDIGENSDVAYEAPATELEKSLAAIWQEVLGIERIGVHENFFSLGGNSIKGIHVVNKIQEWLEEIVHVTVIFEAPTIRELAAKLEEYRSKEPAGAAVDEAKIKRMRRSIPSIPPAPPAARTLKNPPAVFILSPPRSGTTLLRVILAGHPRLFAPPELELLSFNTLQERKSTLSGRFGYFTEGAVRAIMEIKECTAREALSIMEELERKNLGVQQFYRMLQEWLGERILVDKTPFYTLDSETLKRAERYFESPRYIHLIRNPYAAIHSFEEAKLDQIIRFNHDFPVRELAESVWVIGNQNIKEFLEGVPAGRKFAVKFEELVREPGSVVPGICEFLGIDFKKEMIRVYENTANKMTDGIHAESKMLGDIKFFRHKTIDTSVVDRWKSKYKKDFIGEITRDLAKSFGYAGSLDEKARLAYSRITPAPRAPYYELSHAQKRLWILEQFDKSQTAYNIFGAFLFEGELDRAVLEKALETAVRRHESLRTTFSIIDGDPRQIIHEYESLGFEFKAMDLRDQADREERARILANEQFKRPFDLENGPVLRAHLIQLEHRQYVFLFTLPHLIADGWSLGVLVNELSYLYIAYKGKKENSLPPLEIQYKDFSYWQNTEKIKEAVKQQEAYWLNRFEGELPVLNLPADYRRPVVQSFEGDRIRFSYDEKMTGALNTLAGKENASLYMVLLAIYSIFLSRISGREDIVIGTPVAGRGHAELQYVIGMFVNTLALRVHPEGSKTVTGYLKETRKRILEAFENQDYPFEDLVDRVVVRRDTSRNPLFDVLFALQNTYTEPPEIPGTEMEDPQLTLRPFEFENSISKFDMGLFTSERGGNLSLTLEYSTKLFKQETMERFVRYLKQISSEILHDPGKKISELEIMSAEEKHRVLYGFNNTFVEYPRDKTIHRLFAEQAGKCPDSLALIGETGPRQTPGAKRLSVTYGELNRRTDNMAALLTRKGVSHGTVVGLMAGRSLENITGILGILKCGGVYLPIDPDYPAERIDFMLKDSHAAVVLDFADLNVNLASDFQCGASDFTSANLAYIMYTSGSTGKPKGVMVEHQSVIRLVVNSDFVDLNRSTRVLQTGAPVFDAVTFEIWGSLLNGGELHLVGNEIILDAGKLGRELAENHINTLWLSSPLFNQLMEQDSNIFSTLQFLVVGGDVLSPKHINRVRRENKGLQVVNGYGPTENTTFSLCYSIERDFEGSIPIGKPINNSTAYIVDRYGRLQPVGIAGELWVGGDGVSRGYLNSPELTAEKFIKHRLYNSNEKTLYKTGDLAKWLADGSIEFLGRVDYQVKIRGFRVELGEIESRLLKHREINEALVKVTETKPGGGDKLLCAYITARREFRVTELKEYLEHLLPGYMVPSYFMQLEKMPLTPNGKVDREGLPSPRLPVDRTYTAPANEIEEKLAVIWAEVLGIEKEVIGVHDDFFELGGHSLKATLLASRISKEFNVEFSLPNVFTGPTIMEFAQIIRRAETSIYREIKPVSKKEYYPQSSAQKRLFFLEQFDNIGTSYNIPSALQVEGKLDIKRLEHAIHALVERHETLRTSFALVDNKPVQIVHETVPFEIEGQIDGQVYEPRQPVEKIIENFIQPFDLSKAPLFRVGLVLTGKDRYLLLYDLHHIIGDGTSMGILTDDFSRLYGGQELLPLKVQYKDFSAWQNRLIETGEIKKQEDYWLAMYEEGIPKLNFPTDYPRPGSLSFEGDRYRFRLEKGEAQAVKTLAVEKGATLFMVLSAAFYVLLYRYTGQEDMVVGTGIMGRAHVDLHRIIGMFVNSLPLRSQPCGEKTYLQFLEEVKETSIRAFANQEIQFEALVEKLNIERDPTRNPLFDVMLVVQNFEQGGPENSRKTRLKDVSFSPFKRENKTSKFDLNLSVWEAGDSILFTLEYATALFKSSTIREIAGDYVGVLKQVINKREIRLKDVAVSDDLVKERLLHSFNDTQAGWPMDKTVYGLFAEQVLKTPGNTAVVLEKDSLTYRELDKKANQLAGYLYLEKNIRPDHRVGLLMDKSVWCIAAILGIQKAGGGYVPIDPLLPPDGVRHIIDDAGIEVLISRKKHIKILHRLQWECQSLHTFLCLDSSDIYSEEEAQNPLMDRKLWEYVGERAADDITGGGWLSSYTGEPLSKKEMDEYGKNAALKLIPLLDKTSRILEIGCATGLTMYRLAPEAGFYYGTDLSPVIIRQNRERIEKQGLANIKLDCLPAHEIHKIEEENFDLIILNSVIQHFNGHNYLRQVIEKAIRLLGERGTIFIGDIMDQERKQALIRELKEFKQTHNHQEYRTKTDWSEELFVSGSFFRDLCVDFPVIRDVEFSDKIGTIENELTKFRYDALISVDKTAAGNLMESGKLRQKHKYQDDLRALERQSLKRLNPSTPAAPHDLLYIIYTSGTTGKPKGMMIEHRNVVRLMKNDKSLFDFNEDDVWTMFHAYNFDFSVWEMYGALLFGGKLVIIPRMTARDTEKYLQILKEQQVTVLNQTPSAFYNLSREECHLPGKELKIRTVIFGGEALDPQKLKPWKEKYPRMQLINMYGITETTVHVTYKELTCEELESGTGNIGKPIPTLSTYIMDGDFNLLPIGAAGELFVGGEGIGRGYLNRPELTAERFLDLAAKTREDTRISSLIIHRNSASFRCLYRTGDLVRHLSNGDLEYLGRIDQQVKIRGFRIELGEIESHLRSHEGIKDVLVVAKEDMDGDRFLCAYVVGERVFDLSELKDYLAKKIPEYMIPLYFVPMDKIPLTSNGKVDRKALPEPTAPEVDDNHVPPRDHLEEQLVDIWAEVLHVEKEKISIDSNFFQLGGHSLKATILVSNIHKALDVKVPLAEIFKTQTIRGLSQYIKKAEKEKFSVIQPVEKKEYYAQSSAQKRLYILQQMELRSTNYNVPQMLPLKKDIKKETLEDIFKKLTARHESLRTSFAMVDDTPVQRIHDSVDFTIDDYNYNEKSDLTLAIATMRRDFVKPFDLSKAPLLRIGLQRIREEEAILFIDMHHIITDGVSRDVLIEEFAALSSGERLPSLKLQYKDFSGWQNKREQEGLIKRQEEFWLNRFSGELPVLELPADFPRPEMQSFEGASAIFTLNEKRTGAVKRTAKQLDATLYMTLLSMFTVLLSKLSGQEDIILGTPAAGRRHADIERIIGMFVNTLPMRNHPLGEKPFNEFLKEVKKRTLESYENQDYQFEDLVDKLAVRRDTGRSPVFDVMFNLLNQSEYAGDVPGGNTGNTKGENVYKHKKGTSKFDLNLTAVDFGERLYFILEYCTRLFKPETIERFIDYFKQIVSVLGGDTGQKISTIDIMAGEERDRILYHFNNTKTGYPGDKTIRRQFEEQVEKSPGNTAITAGNGNRQISYRELNRRSNQLARLLRKEGVKAGVIVGLKPERCIEMIIGMLAVLKAGGAYLPLGPEYRAERVKSILADSGTKILLTHPGENSLKYPLLKIDLKNKENYKEDTSNLPLASASTDPAYVIYTSGTTGLPKGVMIENRAVLNFITGISCRVNFTESDRILSLTTLSFDIFGLETILPLTKGSKVVVGSKEEQLDPEAIVSAVKRENITIFQVTPSRLQLLISSYNASHALKPLKYLLVGGEAFPDLLLEKARPLTGGKIFNLYGPTETTIWSTIQDLTGTAPLNIGKPISNTQVYILSKAGLLQPVGVNGELCIGGDGLARGYLNRPELTAGKFIENPCIKGERIYRTGDLAQWLPEGDIEFLGRRDHQVKIRGFRIELEEIERRLQAHDDIQKAVVLALEDEKRDKYLCAYIVSGKELEVSELREYLSGELPDYMVPSYFTPIDDVPLTPNGKIDRKALANLGTAVTVKREYKPPRDILEKKLVELWSDVLGIEEGIIGIDANFFELGGHSLMATVLISKIHQALDVHVTLGEIFLNPTAGSLARYINRSKREDKHVSIKPAEKKEYYALSSAQKRLYVIQQLNPLSTDYNLPGVVVKLEGPLDRQRLETAFNHLIDRHESFRTGFVVVEDEPVQKIHDANGIDFKINYYEIVEEEARDLVNGYIRPFDLSRPPLLRVVLIKTGTDSHILMVDMHHIITDAISSQIYITDLAALYQGEELPDIAITYKDFSQWHNKLLQTGEIKKQEDYWLKEFAGELPMLRLPLDAERPPVKSFEGDTYIFRVEDEPARGLNKLAKQEDATLFMVLLAVFYIFLHKLSGQEDIIVGTDSAGRRHADLEPIIGMFVNSFAMRNYPSHRKTFREFLGEVRKRTIEAFDNQDYQFENLVEKVLPNRDPAHNPLYDVMFSYHNIAKVRPDNMQMDDTGLIIRPYTFDYKVAKFDLMLHGEEIDGMIRFHFEYSTKLFKKSTIEEFSGIYKMIILQVLENPGSTLGEIDVFSREEKDGLLKEIREKEGELFADEIREDRDNPAEMEAEFDL